MTSLPRELEKAAGFGRFFVDCREIDGPRRYSLDGDAVVPIASMYKVVLALEVADRIASGDLDADELIVIEPHEHTPAGEGLNHFSRPAAITRPDLMYLALAWSDNTASDVLLREVGVEAVHARARQVGLSHFSLVGDCRTLLNFAGEDLGYPCEDAAAQADWAPRLDDDDLALHRTNTATPAELSHLAVMLQQDAAAHPAACRMVRDAMAQQVWRARFGTAFPAPRWRLASKTGTLPPWRGEFGIVQDGLSQLAITVIVRQHRAAATDVEIDQQVSLVARAVAQHLSCDL